MPVCEPQMHDCTSFPMGARKRTSSFYYTPSSGTAPRPSKAPRLGMGNETRTKPYTTTTCPSTSYTSVPRSLRTAKEKATASFSDSSLFPHYKQPSAPPTMQKEMPRRSKPQNKSGRSCTSLAAVSCRTSSPLSPSQTILPARPTFPRSKAEPDLYRLAIRTRMQHSPQGKKILHMGPRLAISIMTATMELEKLVAQHSQDVDMFEDEYSPHTGNSWVVVPGEDWEMVDCAA